MSRTVYACHLSLRRCMHCLPLPRSSGVSSSVDTEQVSQIACSARVFAKVSIVYFRNLEEFLKKKAGVTEVVTNVVKS